MPVSLLGALLAVSPAGFDGPPLYDVDTSFATSPTGWRRLYFGSQDEKGIAIARAPGGGYVVCLSVPGGAAGALIGLIKLDAQGALVPGGFGNGGTVLKDAFLSSVTDMTIDAQGRIVVIGATPGPGNATDFGIVRFNADGSDDTGFAGDGGTSFGFDVPGNGLYADDVPVSVLAQSDGKIVVAGGVQYTTITTSARVGVVRLNVDGSLDRGFGTIGDGMGGHLGTDFTFLDGKSAYAAKIVRIAGDHFVVAGTSVYSATDTDFAARILTPEGSVWADGIGSVTFAIDEPGPGGSLYDTVTAAALADPTTLYLAGNASGHSAAVRVKVGPPNQIGQYYDLGFDTSFLGSGLPGRPHIFVGAADTEAKAAAVAPDGRLLILGRVNTGVSQGALQQLQHNGSLDYYVFPNALRPYSAPTTAGTNSYYTEFSGVVFDGMRPVVLGSSVDSTTTTSDFDGVVTRLLSDTIFAHGFDARP